jgi:hypothetical protein
LEFKSVEGSRQRHNLTRSGQREEGRGIDPTLKFAGEGGRAADREKARSGSRDLDGTRPPKQTLGHMRILAASPLTQRPSLSASLCEHL